LRMIVVVILALLASASARANDSSAALATGGLVFVRNPDVEIRAEDLFISTAWIKVRYRFFNNAPHDVTTLVAFPMPEIVIDHADTNISIPTEDPENILGFSTLADGRLVATRIEQKVLANGIDRTDMLRGLGIPLAPHLRGTAEALDRLPEQSRRELLQLGLVETEEYDDGRGMKKHLEPRWALRTTHYWQQTFPAQRELVIEHRYKPSVGSSVATEAETAEHRKRYCIDQDLLKALEEARGGAPRDALPFSERRIEYVLTTGANWSGPIRQFRLVVDKGDQRNLVSFCGEGVKKISSTQFEMRKNDFTPDQNLNVLILERNSAQR
jgi:hypothetical protein